MTCPICHHEESNVIESRAARRRRQCCRCKYRWTTYEVPAEDLERLQEIERRAKGLADAVAPR